MTEHFVKPDGEGTGGEAKPRVDVTKQRNFVAPTGVVIPVVDGKAREDLAVQMHGEIIGDGDNQMLVLTPVLEDADGTLSVEVGEERPGVPETFQDLLDAGIAKEGEPFLFSVPIDGMDAEDFQIMRNVLIAQQGVQGGIVDDVEFMNTRQYLEQARAASPAVGAWVNAREADGVITTHFQELPPKPNDADLEGWVKRDLEEWAEQSARADLALANYTLKVAEIWGELDPEVAARMKVALAQAEMARDEEVKAAQEQMAELKAAIVDRVAVLGRSVPGTRVQAVYAAPRGVWNDDMLAGYAVEHPEVWAFRRNSAPSVSVKFLTTPRVKSKK